MLTQYQTTEPQAAILAACPRPRVLAPTTFAFRASVATRVPAAAPVSAPRVPGAWSQAVAPIAALPQRSVRRPGSAAERSEAGYGVSRVLADAVRVEVGSGNGNGGNAGGIAGIVMAGTNQQDKQHRQYLTARREPVTWRPPR